MESVSPDVKAKILAENDAIERDWIVESILFYDNSGVESPMTGDTKLFTPDPADCGAAGEDIQFIVSKLSEWSTRFELTWTLEIAGVDLGQINAGAPDPKIIDTALALISVGDMDFDDPYAFL